MNMTIIEFTIISATKDGEVVFEHLVGEETPRYPDQDTNMSKYDRLDFDEAFEKKNRATLYVEEKK